MSDSQIEKLNSTYWVPGKAGPVEIIGSNDDQLVSVRDAAKRCKFDAATLRSWMKQAWRWQVGVVRNGRYYLSEPVVQHLESDFPPEPSPEPRHRNVCLLVDGTHTKKIDFCRTGTGRAI
jgi:hypothetical protein